MTALALLLLSGAVDTPHGQLCVHYNNGQSSSHWVEQMASPDSISVVILILALMLVVRINLHASGPVKMIPSWAPCGHMAPHTFWASGIDIPISHSVADDVRGHLYSTLR